MANVALQKGGRKAALTTGLWHSPAQPFGDRNTTLLLRQVAAGGSAQGVVRQDIGSTCSMSWNPPCKRPAGTMSTTTCARTSQLESFLKSHNIIKFLVLPAMKQQKTVFCFVLNRKTLGMLRQRKSSLCNGQIQKRSLRKAGKPRAETHHQRIASSLLSLAFFKYFIAGDITHFWVLPHFGAVPLAQAQQDTAVGTKRMDLFKNGLKWPFQTSHSVLLPLAEDAQTWAISAPEDSDDRKTEIL